jgi:cytochrome c oxidase cbb3-type subunit I/II
MYRLRAIGGLLFVAGAVMMTVNLIKTARKGTFIPEQEAQAPALSREVEKEEKHPYRHQWLERKPVLFTILTTVAILVGGLVEIIPMFVIRTNVPTISSVRPYTPLEVLGRDIYIREGCVGCHSQLVRPFRSETERYAAHIMGGSDLYSKAGEYVYDHPFLWGSKRTGPDLHRVGRKYPDAWHFRHMENPESTSPGSIMPPYSWLLTREMDTASIPARIKALRKVGVPYPEGYEEDAIREATEQAEQIKKTLEENMVETTADKEIIALIAYLQRLGTDIRTDLKGGAAP